MSIFATGFTMIVDIAFDHDGSQLVLEHDTNGPFAPGGEGRLSRVAGDGAVSTIWGGLVTTTALAIGADGACYVTNLAAGDGIGQVLRIAPVPEPATWLTLALGLGLLLARRKT